MCVCIGGGVGRHMSLEHENARKGDLEEIGRTRVLLQRSQALLKILGATFGRQCTAHSNGIIL